MNLALTVQGGRNGLPFETVALVLQGGAGLLQAGVYEGLAAAGIEPNWVAGISIGALDTAVMTGNSSKLRVKRLRDFFVPRGLLPWLGGKQTVQNISFYDTAALKSTLLRLVDFDLINHDDVRVSVGAVNIRTSFPAGRVP